MKDSTEHTHIYLKVTVNKALGKLTSGLSVVDSEAGAERPEEPSLSERLEIVRYSSFPACINRHALFGFADWRRIVQTPRDLQKGCIL